MSTQVFPVLAQNSIHYNILYQFSVIRDIKVISCLPHEINHCKAYIILSLCGKTYFHSQEQDAEDNSIAPWEDTLPFLAIGNIHLNLRLSFQKGLMLF